MKEYIPTQLDSENIDSLFFSCLPMKEETKVIKCVLFQTSYGFSENARPIFFDEKALQYLSPDIEFALGQLKAVHEGKTTITTEDITILYNGTVWVEDNNTLLKFLHLACALNLISPLNAKDSSVTLLKNIYPTISDQDPNFYEWEKVHKPEILKRIEEENK